ncbi:MAG: helix-turn-helix domain-containing protein [Patescibacteria group bacterium]|nr:helix-turn-helix domain-containing protein [Patescibacteria group bacterium]
MNNDFYSKFFPGIAWRKYTKKICTLLTKETVLITALPDAGISFFLKNVEEYYKNRDMDKNLLITLEILPGQEEIFHLAQLIKEQINILLSFPLNIADLSCTDTVKKLVQEKKELVIIINRFERLQGKKEAQAFLNSLRAINPAKVRFLISCYITCQTQPQDYKAAGMLTTANVEFLPTFKQQEISLLLDVYKKVYGWDVQEELSNDIYKLSGGFPGIAKYIAKFASDNKLSKISTKKLLSQPSIAFKLENLLQTLEAIGLMKAGEVDFSKKDLLQKLGLVDTNDLPKIGILPKYKPDKIKSVNLAKHLSAQEFELLRLFANNNEEIITLDQVADAIWKEHSTQKFSLWSIYKVISNLNKKIKRYGLEIENFKGRGYALTTDPNLDPAQAKSLLESIRTEGKKN